VSTLLLSGEREGGARESGGARETEAGGASVSTLLLSGEREGGERGGTREIEAELERERRS
jgi:hypothetical protein